MLFPVGANLICKFEYFRKNSEVVHAADIHTRCSELPVHGHLLGRTLYMLLECFALHFGQEFIAYKAARQLDIVHQAGSGCCRAEKVNVADHRCIY